MLTRRRLWLGPDHLLSVKRSFLSEEYRRFYYCDIEAFVLTEVEDQSRFYTFLLAGIAAVTAGLLVASNESFWAMQTGVACVLLLLFALRRTDARCTLRTRTGTHLLPSLRTMERARAAAQMLKEEIDRAQAALPPESFAEQTPIEARALPAAKRYHGLLHYSAFVLMLLVALTRGFRPLTVNAVYLTISFGLDIILTVVSIGAAVNQRGSDISRIARGAILFTLVWAALFSFIVEFVATTRIMPLFAFEAFPSWRDPLTDLSNTTIALYVVTGIVGLIAMFTHKQPVRRS